MATLNPPIAAFSVEVFYDGDCPLCVREIRMLQRLDKRQRIRFTDIAAADFDPSCVGLSYATLMSRIYGRLANGSLIEGVEVFRQLYASVGFSALVAVTRWPGIRQILDIVYGVFARHRLRLTGRCTPQSCAAAAPRSR